MKKSFGVGWSLAPTYFLQIRDTKKGRQFLDKTALRFDFIILEYGRMLHLMKQYNLGLKDRVGILQTEAIKSYPDWKDKINKMILSLAKQVLKEIKESEKEKDILVQIYHPCWEKAYPLLKKENLHNKWNDSFIPNVKRKATQQGFSLKFPCTIINQSEINILEIFTGEKNNECN